VTDTCWADPLSRKERRALADKLASACGQSWRAAEAERLRYRRLRTTELARAEVFTLISIEMSQLHVDVTERAEVATS
jgi:hypothetical protein